MTVDGSSITNGSAPDPQSASQRAAVGGRLREWRLRRELTQTAVARAACVMPAARANYETGKRDMPLSTFLGVVAALDVSAGDLLDIPDVIGRRQELRGP